MPTLIFTGLLLAAIAGPAHAQLAPEARTDMSDAGPALEDDVRSFLEAFIDGENTPSQQLAFFADRVHYYDRGVVSRAAIARDIEYTMRRWPSRDNRLVEIDYLKPLQDEDKVFVSYVVDYEVAGDDRLVQGRARYGAVIGELGAYPRIEGIFENVVSRRRQSPPDPVRPDASGH